MFKILEDTWRLYLHAYSTQQEPTQWRVGSTAYKRLLSGLRDYASTSVARPEVGDTLWGVSLVNDPTLPENRIVLQAGHNTVGACDAGGE